MDNLNEEQRAVASRDIIVMGPTCLSTVPSGDSSDSESESEEDSEEDNDQQEQNTNSEITEISEM